MNECGFCGKGNKQQITHELVGNLLFRGKFYVHWQQWKLGSAKLEV
jgi:hypothetical protein